MFNEDKHPRDEEGKFTEKNERVYRQNVSYSEILSDTPSIINASENPKILSFNNGEQANKFFAAEEERWKATLTDEQKKTINAYTDKLYEIVNATLRGQKLMTDDDIDKATHDIDSAIENFRLTDDITVYRGTTIETHNKTFYGEDPKIGEIKTFPAYLSTAAIYEAVQGMDVIYEISVPKGIGHGAYINSLSEYKDAEYEFLLPRDIMVKIVNFNKNKDGKKIIKMEVIT